MRHSLIVLFTLAVCTQPAVAQTLTLPTSAPDSLRVGQTAIVRPQARDVLGRPASVARVQAVSLDTLTLAVNYATGGQRYTARRPGVAVVLWQWDRTSGDRLRLVDTVRVLAAPAPPDTTTPAEPPPPSDTSSGHARLPELPRVWLETSYPAVTGRTIPVATGDELQAALDSAVLGDEIVLEAGTTYIRHGFRLPRKTTGEGWIVLRTSGTLPPEGQRVTPAHAAQMPRLLNTVPGQAVLTAESGAHHYRLVGLEVTFAPGTTRGGALISFGGSGAALEDVPHDLVLDRLYVHGQPETSFQRCLALHTASTAVIDSWIDKCHGLGFDSQAIASWNGPGPFKIVNNYLAGAGENVMFGGADPASVATMAADIEIRRNHFHKPPAWKGRWTVKNLFELKVGRRVLVEGNVFENNWTDAQIGTAIVLKSTNQGGKAPWSETSDLTFRYNIVRNVAHGLGIAGSPERHPSVRANTVLIEHNLVEAGVGDYPGGRLFSTSDVPDLTIRHNSTRSTHSALLFSSRLPNERLTVVNNVFSATSYPISGQGSGGLAALEGAAPGWTFVGNVLPGANVKTYPPGNAYPARGAVTAATTAGVGADLEGVRHATAGVVVVP